MITSQRSKEQRYLLNVNGILKCYWLQQQQEHSCWLVEVKVGTMPRVQRPHTHRNVIIYSEQHGFRQRFCFTFGASSTKYASSHTVVGGWPTVCIQFTCHEILYFGYKIPPPERRTVTSTLLKVEIKRMRFYSVVLFSVSNVHLAALILYLWL